MLAEIKHSLLITKSTIPNSGNGVFTNTKINKESQITTYRGKRKTKLEFEQLLKNQNKEALHYSVTIPNSSDVIIGNIHTKDLRSCGQFINDSAAY